MGETAPKEACVPHDVEYQEFGEKPTPEILHAIRTSEWYNQNKDSGLSFEFDIMDQNTTEAARICAGLYMKLPKWPRPLSSLYKFMFWDVIALRLDAVKAQGPEAISTGQPADAESETNQEEDEGSDTEEPSNQHSSLENTEANGSIAASSEDEDSIDFQEFHG